MRFVKSDKPVTTNHAKLGELSVMVEVPQVDSLDEFVSFCGGSDAALTFVNSQIETNAKNGGRATLRNLPESANLEEATEKVMSVVHDYSPAAGASRGPSVKAKAVALDSAIAKVTSADPNKKWTTEELLALLAQGR